MFRPMFRPYLGMSVQITYIGRYNENLKDTFLHLLKFLFRLPEYVPCIADSEDGLSIDRNM
jgi:hypothetical protein